MFSACLALNLIKGLSGNETVISDTMQQNVASDVPITFCPHRGSLEMLNFRQTPALPAGVLGFDTVRYLNPVRAALGVHFPFK